MTLQSDSQCGGLGDLIGASWLSPEVMAAAGHAMV